MNDIVALSTREMEATIANDKDLIALLAGRLEMARRHKDALLSDYQEHISGHGC